MFRLQKFCRYAQGRRLIFTYPTAAVQAPQSMALRGPALLAERQRQVFRRWSTDPRGASARGFVGVAALLQGATTQDLEDLTDADIDHE